MALSMNSNRRRPIRPCSKSQVIVSAHPRMPGPASMHDPPARVCEFAPRDFQNAMTAGEALSAATSRPSRLPVRCHCPSSCILCPLPSRSSTSELQLPPCTTTTPTGWTTLHPPQRRNHETAEPMIAIPPEQIPAKSGQVQTLAPTTSNPHDLSSESDGIQETDRAPVQPLPTNTIEINQSATCATDEAVSTPLSSLSLSDLKAKAAELGITDPPGHKGHKSTWIEALIEDAATLPSKPPPEATDRGIQNHQSESCIVYQSQSGPVKLPDTAVSDDDTYPQTCARPHRHRS